MILMASGDMNGGALSVEDQLALVRRDQEKLERRVDLIEAMLAAIRMEDDPSPEPEP